MMVYLAFAEPIQLVPDGTLLLHVAIILLMIYVLNRTLFRPINRVLEEREQRTRERSEGARDILKRVDESLSRYEQSLREARAEGYRLLEQQRAEALGTRQSELGATREEIGRLVGEKREAIRQQAQDARGTLEEEARRVAASISTQILRRPVGGPSRPGVRV